MNEVKEVTIRIKDEERTVKHKFLLYEPLELSEGDPIIQGCIKEAMEAFKGEASSIKVTCTLVIL
jgi:hypothetical protein